MKKRFFAAALIVIGVAGGTVLFVYERATHTANTSKASEQRAGVVQGASREARTLLVRTVNGDTNEPVGNVLVRVEEQSSSVVPGRSVVISSSRSLDDGIAVFRVPDGEYIIRSIDSGWSGYMTARLTTNADLYLNLRKIQQ